MVTPRMLLTIKKRLKRLDLRADAAEQQKPADEAWHKMLQRLDAEETERRLSSLETALNRH
jgi:hypothetical protein